MSTFEAQLKAFADRTEGKIKRAVGEAVQDLLQDMQTTAQGRSAGGVLIEGRIPVVSADLVNSLLSSVNGSAVAKGPGSYAMAVAGFDLGDEMRFAWTMEYARRVHEGFRGTDAAGRTYNQPGWHWISANAPKWPGYLARHTEAVK